LTTGQAFAAGPAPALIVNRFGQGQAIYLNFTFTDARPPGGEAQTMDLEDLLRHLLRLTDLPPPPRVLAGGEECKDVEIHTFQDGSALYLGLLTGGDHTARSRTVQLASRYHVYDVVAGKYLGYTNSVPLHMEPSDGKVLALLPSRPPPLRIILPARAERGRMLRGTVAGGNGDYRRYARLRVTDPRGQSAEYFNDLLPVRQQAQVAWPIALDAPTGTWKVEVADVITGQRIVWSMAVIDATPEGTSPGPSRTRIAPAS
jgi:hypothetical protein